MKKSKSRILLVVLHEYIKRDLVDTGVIAHLATKFDLQLLLQEHIDPEPLLEFGPIHFVGKPPKWPHLVWNNTRVLKSMMRWEPIFGKLGRAFHNRRKNNNYRGLLKYVDSLHRAGLGSLVAWFGTIYMRYSMPKDLLAGQQYDAVLIPTVMRDYWADMMVRWCRVNETPSVFMQVNVDTLNYKTPIEKPDYLALWGEQSWYIARLVYWFRGAQLRIIGSPRFEIYHSKAIDSKQARRDLDLPLDRRIIMLCGGDATFDNIRALKLFESAMTDGRISKDLMVLYKPHPRAEVLSEFGHGLYRQDELPNTRLYSSPYKEKWPPLEEYPRLFAAVDAVITPFSTMGLEAALNGLPVMCVGYHAEQSAFWEFAHYIHNKFYFHTSWAVICDAEDMFISSLVRLGDMCGDEWIAAQAKGSALNIAYHDRTPYEARLESMLTEVIVEWSGSGVELKQHGIG